MTKVLRLGVDTRVELFNGTGGLVEGCMQSIDRNASVVVALEEPEVLCPKGIQLHIFTAFGTTYLCIEKNTGKEFACKSIAKRKLLTPEDVRREIQILHHLAGHPNIISIVDAYEDVVAVHLVMELCAGGEPFNRIIQKGHYTEKAAVELARVIVEVVEACHSLGVMHLNLKPENFLSVNLRESSPLKMIDFGLSIFFLSLGISLLMLLGAHTMQHLKCCRSSMDESQMYENQMSGVLEL